MKAKDKAFEKRIYSLPHYQDKNRNKSADKIIYDFHMKVRKYEITYSAYLNCGGVPSDWVDKIECRQMESLDRAMVLSKKLNLDKTGLKITEIKE